ncbi:hypothetical protein QE152_g29911 [Popillia japonica]|uniref:Uncharacterized protein n=1 Tax=Popillia japonica TaxID=7064 RepID=A0AAW1JG04_POPJA
MQDNLKSKKTEYLSRLLTIVEETANIKQCKRVQASNPKWMEERAFRLTGSNFGRIYKMRNTTSSAKKVEQLLYSKLFGNTATKYGAESEILAIKQFEEVIGAWN